MIAKISAAPQNIIYAHTSTLNSTFQSLLSSKAPYFRSASLTANERRIIAAAVIAYFL